MQRPGKKENAKVCGLVDAVFSWSLADVRNNNLFRNKVYRIPKTFVSTDQYFGSFIPPLLEETRADLLSHMGALVHAPSSQILNVKISKDFKAPRDLIYNIVLRTWMGRDKYEPQVGDLFAFVQEIPRCISDLDRTSRPYTLGYVMRNLDFGSRCMIITSKPLEFSKEAGMKMDGKRRETLFAVFLTSLTTNIRIWNGLHPVDGNFNVIRSVLQQNPSVGGNCNICSAGSETSAAELSSMNLISSFGLDDSQKDAVSNCIALRERRYRSTVKLIWGPPGTGKTKTVASMLFALGNLNCRTLTCAPTNTAVIGVAKRLMSLIIPSLKSDTFGLGDILVFGYGERMKIDDHEDLHEVFLDYRVSKLSTSSEPLSMWRSSLQFMISLLEHPKEQYDLYVDRAKCVISETCDIKDDGKGTEQKKTCSKDIVKLREDNTDSKKVKNEIENVLVFEEFLAKEFRKLSGQLNSCIIVMFTHLPASFVPVNISKKMRQVLDFLHALENLPDDIIVNIVGRGDRLSGTGHGDSVIGILRVLFAFSLPELTNPYKIRDFCLKNARLLFCTASSAAKLNVAGMPPVEMVIIDEAAQLKECESCIPLQLPGLRNAVLIGDEKQLPAMVQSQICENINFGRSLFERLVKLGHPRHILKVQYRMHPSISFFPRKHFYDDKIVDGPNVRGFSHDKRFLKGRIYGSYSFIDVSTGKEGRNDIGSTENMVEVFVAAEIVDLLNKVSVATKKKIRVGVISPYKAQVLALEEKICKRYSTDVTSNFSVIVRSVDGFQGSEEDIIIISTVRCNRKGSVGFLSNLPRANVALTRARHCLWILGSGTTLINSHSIWKEIVLDAKSRGCFHNASEDEKLNKAMNEALFRTDSPLFIQAEWKVCFSDEFLKSMTRIKFTGIRMEIISVLQKIISGWRTPRQKSYSLDMYAISSQLMEIYDINATLKLIWTIDILKENSEYLQVIKVWGVIPSPKIPDLARRLDKLFKGYKTAVINRCKDKVIHRNLVIPKVWLTDVYATTKTDRNSDPRARLVSRFAALKLIDEVDQRPPEDITEP